MFKDASRIDRTTIEPLYALRSTAGVALPLVIALVLRHPLSGVSAALGAMCVGFASRQGVYRTRAAVMILTSAGTALGALVGCLTGGDPALNVATTALWGLASAFIAVLGASANAVGLNSLVAFIVFSQFGFTFEQAGQQAALVFAGGLLQTVLLVLVWPLQRFSAERGVLERAYRALGDAAVHLPPHHKLQSPDAQALGAVSDTLADPQPFAKRGETAVFEALLAEAERIRGSLAALTTDRYAADDYPLPQAAGALAELSEATRDILVEIADGLRAARAPADLPAVWTRLDAGIAALEAHARALAASQGLAGQLRAAWRAGKAPVEPNAGPPSESPTARLFRPSVISDALQTLRANGTIASPFGRHALRVGITLAIAAAAEHVLDAPRAYWIPLTAAIVLRPDFGATFTRGGARVGGTLLGALAASLIALLLHPGPELYLVLALVAACGAYLTVAANYALFTVGITAYVVFLLAFGGLAAHTAVFERLWASLLGGVLALLAYVVWPAWERERVSVELAHLLDKARQYTDLVLRAYSDPNTRDDEEISAAQLATRLARVNAETSVDRTLAEPVHTRTVSVRVALGVLAASRRLSLATLTLQTRLPRAVPVSAPELAQLRDAVDTSLRVLVAALEARVEPPPLPPLRELQVALRGALMGTPAGADGMLVSETDLLVDSVKTIADLLQRGYNEIVGRDAAPTTVVGARRA
jgi:uncharacterized membrane protein YccC